MIQYKPICRAEDNHRFTLEQEGENVLIVIGLNPSTADANKPDPTMRKVLSFVNECGYDGFVMLNLSSERCTEPKNLARTLDEKMHKKNLRIVSEYEMKYPDADVLVAFGNNIELRDYLRICFNDIWETLGEDTRWLRIGGPKGITSKGHPRHPLYAKVSDGLVDFDADAYAEKLMNSHKRLKRKSVDFKAIAAGIYAALADKVGRQEVSVSELVHEMFGPAKSEYIDPYVGWASHFDKFTIVEDDYWKIYELFWKLVRKHKEYLLDSSSYAEQTVGLPYNIPFVVKRIKK